MPTRTASVPDLPAAGWVPVRSAAHLSELARTRPVPVTVSEQRPSDVPPARADHVPGQWPTLPATDVDGLHAVAVGGAADRVSVGLVDGRFGHRATVGDLRLLEAAGARLLPAAALVALRRGRLPAVRSVGHEPLDRGQVLPADTVVLFGRDADGRPVPLAPTATLVRAGLAGRLVAGLADGDGPYFDLRSGKFALVCDDQPAPAEQLGEHLRLVGARAVRPRAGRVPSGRSRFAVGCPSRCTHDDHTMLLDPLAVDVHREDDIPQVTLCPCAPQDGTVWWLAGALHTRRTLGGTPGRAQTLRAAVNVLTGHGVHPLGAEERSRLKVLLRLWSDGDDLPGMRLVLNDTADDAFCAAVWWLRTGTFPRSRAVASARQLTTVNTLPA